MKTLRRLEASKTAGGWQLKYCCRRRSGSAAGRGGGVGETESLVLEFSAKKRFVGCRRGQSGGRRPGKAEQTDRELAKRIHREGGSSGAHLGDIDLLLHFHSSLFAAVKVSAGCCTVLVTSMLSSFTFLAAQGLASSHGQSHSTALLPLHKR